MPNHKRVSRRRQYRACLKLIRGRWKVVGVAYSSARKTYLFIPPVGSGMIDAKSVRTVSDQDLLDWGLPLDSFRWGELFYMDKRKRDPLGALRLKSRQDKALQLASDLSAA